MSSDTARDGRPVAAGAGLVVAAAVLSTVLAGCAAPGRITEESGSSPGAVTTPLSTTIPAALPPAPSGVPALLDDGSTGTPLPGSTLRLDGAARAAAVADAAQVMRLFVRRSVPADRWWRDLVPYLSPQTAQDFRHTDPARVPASRVTGPGVVLTDSVPLVARVSVPTDAGVYLLVLSRTDESPTWDAERITPPESAGD